MFVVIFKAEINQLDDEYSRTAAMLRDLAMDQYGCLDFVSMTEGDREIALSYWPSLDRINAWKQDPRHLAAQKQGRKKWYKSYRVQVAELIREY